MPVKPKISILLAEELALVREGIAGLCEASGSFQVAGQCADGAAALELLQTFQPDIAVIDFNIPRIFSLELVRRIKASGGHTRFLILAAKGDRKMALEALRSGANGFVLKSANTDHLLEALQQVAAGSIYVSPELQFERIFLTPRRATPADPLETLSSREYQVFQLIIEGIRAKEIASRLSLSPKTVDTYRASLMRKLDIHDVPGLVKFAIQRDLTSVA
ncbi:MAG TPA: response regulator transcription factor [Bryobacteraceae bacterium]|nr:response regulator transcription factor [Bryobacteraceae bacterium]